jgi:hypothetical protein
MMKARQGPETCREEKQGPDEQIALASEQAELGISVE